MKYHELCGRCGHERIKERSAGDMMAGSVTGDIEKIKCNCFPSWGTRRAVYIMCYSDTKIEGGAGMYVAKGGI